MLDGQGADEQLAGYHTFFKAYLLELLRAGRWQEFRALVRGMRRDHGYSRRGVVTKLLAAALPVSLADALSRRSAACRAVGELLAAGGTRCPDVRDPLATTDGRRRGIRGFSIEQLTSQSLPMLLHWEDRNSMAHSVEARVPFLSHLLVDFLVAVPAREKLGGGVTKALLREAMRDVLPERVRTRRDKMAFAAPEERWMRGENRDAAATALDRALDALRPWMREGGDRGVRGILAGERPWDNLLWRVICFGAWVRRFDVGL